MTIFEFVESRGWHFNSIGRWYTEDMPPEANTLEFKQVLERILKEDSK